MLIHENPNIEIINKNLWAVRFSLIPFIPQISVSSNYTENLNQEKFLLLDSGIVVLNKDDSMYSLLKTTFKAVMKLNSRQITKELNLYAVGALKKTSPNSIVYHAVLKIEQERRKVVKNHGNH